MIRKRPAFTLIELLIVIAIIGILIGSIAVAVTKAKEMANNADQLTKLKNLTMACKVMETQYGRLPPAWATGYGRAPVAPSGKPTASSAPSNFVYMLPFLDQKPLFDANAFAGTSVPVFHSLLDPSLPTPATGQSSFVANIRVFSTYASGIAFDAPVPMATTPAYSGWSNHFSTERIPDGAGQTVFFATKYARCNQQDNLYYAAPHDANGRGAFFGAGNYALESNRPSVSAPSGAQYPVPYQVAPSLATTSTDNSHCNKDRGIFGHSFGGVGLAVAMGDASVRNLSFNVCGEAMALALCPTDGTPLDNDW